MLRAAPRTTGSGSASNGARTETTGKTPRWPHRLEACAPGAELVSGEPDFGVKAKIGRGVFRL